MEMLHQRFELFENQPAVLQKRKIMPGYYEDKGRQYKEENDSHIPRARIGFWVEETVS